MAEVTYIKSKGGRPKGSKNLVKADILKEAIGEGETPLMFMLELMRDPKQPLDIRTDMAKAAAPYVHSKMPTLTIDTSVADLVNMNIGFETIVNRLFPSTMKELN